MTTINKEKCIGCGACEATCPDGFEMGEDGKAKVKNAGVSCVKEAKEACPVDAISQFFVLESLKNGGVLEMRLF